MIRFSAALVAVAIGVLVGGIVASELLLVYIAIVLSAVALVALAAGVILKREELFGKGQGLAPALAGASPGLPDRSGEVPGRATPPSLQGTAAGPGAAFAARSEPVSSQPVSSQPMSPHSAETRDNQPGRGSWGARPTAVPVPGTWQAPGASGVAAGWGTAAPSVFAPRTADTTAAARGAGQAAAPPSWFNPADRAASTEAPASTQTPASGGGWSWLKSDTAVPETAVPDTGEPVAGESQDAALDDDWPARYSWLDDEPEEDGGAGDGGSPAGVGVGAADAGARAKAADGTASAADPVPGDDSPDLVTIVPGATADSAADPAPAPATGKPSGGSGPGARPGGRPSWPSPVAAPTVAAPVMAGQAAAAPTVSTPAVTPPAVPGTTDAVLPGTVLPGTGAVAGTGAAAETVESPALRPDPARDPDPGAGEAVEPEGEPPAEAAGDDPGLVSVVSGVPRFHRADCVLIRFMPEGDTRKMPVAQAREAGCTPCTACEPEG